MIARTLQGIDTKSRRQYVPFVEHLQVFKDDSVCVLPHCELMMVRTFDREDMPETFDRRIIRTIGPTTHTDLNGV